MPAVLTRNTDENRLELDLSTCRGSEFQDAKEKIRDIPGRAFDWPTKTWHVPAEPQIADRVLKTIRPEVSDDIVNWIIESKLGFEESLTTPVADDADDLLLPWASKRMSWQPEFINDEPVNGLKPWQRAFVSEMQNRERVLLADDMGLGKTLMCIASVEEYALRNGQVDGPKLIVAPASVKGGWARELNRWLEDPEVVVIKGTYSKRKPKPGELDRLASESAKDEVFTDEEGKLTPDMVRRLAILEGIENNAWVIVNWEQLRIEKYQIKLKRGGKKTVTGMKEPLFENTEWLAVIADEVHRAKNHEAKQTRGLWRTTGKLMIGATGTPIMNHPGEIWSLMRWLWPTEYHEQGMRRNAVAYWTFYDDFVDYYEDHRDRKVVTGVKNPDALRFVLKDKLIRRTAKILGLKGKQRIYVDELKLNPGQQKLYDEAETVMWLAVQKDAAAGNQDAIEFAKAAVAGGTATTLYNLPNGAARMVRLRQIIENSALLGGKDDSAVMDDFMERFEDSRPEPWVVFAQYKESCNILVERLRSKGYTAEAYTGDVHPKDRTYLEDRFQQGHIDVLVGTIGAMKEGVTLTRSHLMYFLSRDFVPAYNEQAESRQDRLGQQELVRVFIPVIPDTVAADKVEPANRLKEQIVRTVIPKHEIKEV